MNKSILDVFYNVLIKEAMTGRVDCYFKYNMRFNTRIFEDNIEFINDNDSNNLLVPTLLIKDKKEFNRLLLEYIDLALKFYGDEDFYEEILKNKYKEKVLMTTLWSNATIEDFNDPCMFLRKRIAFFELGNLEKYLEEKDVGYSETLGFDIKVEIQKNSFENETPYSLIVNLIKSDTGGRVYEFPRVYFGIYNNEGYVYAIQNDRHRLINSAYFKKIDRIMYKVNDGLDVKDETLENYGVGNLKDVTPNFVVVANIMMGLFRNNNINQIYIPSILISRWNAKMIMLKNKIAKGIDESLIKELEEKYIYIQSNLTEKFLRVFRRLGYHHSTMMISSYPYELSSNLGLSILGGEDICNNKLLDETYKLDFDSKVKGKRNT